MKKLIECVPNFSEGNDMHIINQITDAMKTVEGISVIDVDPGKATNRTVVTMVGEPEPICEAAFRAVKKAVGDKAGMNRYGFFILPMDETLVRTAIDLCDRPILVCDLGHSDGRVRDFNISLCREFFQAFANEAGANLHVKLEYGDEPHHIAEAAFKCFAKALDMATSKDPRRGNALPTTKGKI